MFGLALMTEAICSSGTRLQYNVTIQEDVRRTFGHEPMYQGMENIP
jgi:hypothetical protein